MFGGSRGGGGILRGLYNRLRNRIPVQQSFYPHSYQGQPPMMVVVVPAGNPQTVQQFLPLLNTMIQRQQLQNVLLSGLLREVQSIREEQQQMAQAHAPFYSNYGQQPETEFQSPMGQQPYEQQVQPGFILQQPQTQQFQTNTIPQKDPRVVFLDMEFSQNKLSEPSQDQKGNENDQNSENPFLLHSRFLVQFKKHYDKVIPEKEEGEGRDKVKRREAKSLYGPILGRIDQNSENGEGVKNEEKNEEKKSNAKPVDSVKNENNIGKETNEKQDDNSQKEESSEEVPTQYTVG